MFTLCVAIGLFVFGVDAKYNKSPIPPATPISANEQNNSPSSGDDAVPSAGITSDVEHFETAATHQAHEDSVDSVTVADTRPRDHDVFPALFESALTTVSNEGEAEKHIAIDATIFDQLTLASPGERVNIRFSESLMVQGVMDQLKTYPNSPDTAKGSVNLVDQNAKLNFFVSDGKTQAQILFNEKSKALVYDVSEQQTVFVEKTVSELFCSNPGVIYPLHHPANS